MKKSLAVAAAMLLFAPATASASAELTGSLGSLGPTKEATDVSSPPNPFELATIAVYQEAAPVLAREIGAYSTWEHDFKRDPELSKKAQWAAEKTVESVADQIARQLEDNEVGSGFNIHVVSLVDGMGYRNTVMCGPAPLTVDELREAYVESRQSHVGDNRIHGRGSVGTFNNPLVGVGFAERDGMACSYGLLYPTNFPFF